MQSMMGVFALSLVSSALLNAGLFTRDCLRAVRLLHYGSRGRGESFGSTPLEQIHSHHCRMPGFLRLINYTNCLRAELERASLSPQQVLVACLGSRVVHGKLVAQDATPELDSHLLMPHGIRTLEASLPGSIFTFLCAFVLFQFRFLSK